MRWRLDHFDPQLSIYKMASVDVDQSQKADSYSAQLVFVIGSGGSTKVYRTREDQNWVFDTLEEAPNRLSGKTGYKLSLVRVYGEGEQPPSLCSVKIDMERAVIDSCTPLVEPKAGAKAEAKPEGVGEGATKPEAKQ